MLLQHLHTGPERQAVEKWNGPIHAGTWPLASDAKGSLQSDKQVLMISAAVSMPAHCLEASLGKVGC